MMLFLLCSALGNAAPPPSEEQSNNSVELPSAEQQLETLKGKLTQLEQQLTTATAAAADSSAQQAQLQQQLTAIDQLLQPQSTSEQRQAAIATLAGSDDPRVLSSLLIILQQSIDADRLAVLDALQTMSVYPQTKLLLKQGLYTQDGDTAKKAIAVAANLQNNGLALLLRDYVEAPENPRELRIFALANLKEHYPEVVRPETERLDEANDATADLLVAAASTITGSVMLGSVGVWGVSDEGVAIGTIGGAALGGAGGYLYSRNEKPSTGAATLALSGVGWGLTQGVLLSEVMDAEENTAALLRTAGVLGGIGYGYWSRDRSTQTVDVLESNFMGYWAAQMAVGIHDWVSTPLVYPDDTYSSDEYYDSEMDDYDNDAMDAAYAAYDEQYQARQRRRLGSVMTGSLIGLGASHLLVEPFQFTPQNALFASVVGAEAAAASSLMSSIFNLQSDGFVRTSIHTTAAAALFADHYFPVSYEQSKMAVYGGLTGHALGASLVAVAGLAEDDDRLLQHGLLWGGMLGTATGAWFGQHSSFLSSDWLGVSVGLPYVAANAGLVSAVLNELSPNTPSSQLTGLVGTTTSLGAIGLGYLGYRYNLSTPDTLFLGSSALWGGYYGALLPVALGIESDSTLGYSLLLLGTINAGAGTAAYLLSPNVGYNSMQAVWSQLGGLAGATFGSLGVVLFSESGQAVSIGALAGSTLGLIGGHLLGSNFAPSTSWLPQSSKAPIARLLKRGWQFSLSPSVDAEGQLGAQVSLGLSRW